jgi:hypothetical protein
LIEKNELERINYNYLLKNENKVKQELKKVGLEFDEEGNI